MKIDKLIETLLSTGAHRATYFVSPKHTIQVTRKALGKKFDKRYKTDEFIVTIGRPNYLACKFIKKCQKAGEPFPIKKPQLKFFKAA